MNQSDVGIKEVMREVHVIESSASFQDALSAMICKKSNSLAVVDAEGVYMGMVNAGTLIERAIPEYINNDEVAAHYANEEIFRDAVAEVADMPLQDFMDEKAETITDTASLMQAAVIATKNRQIRIPVLDAEEKPIGLLTRTELKQVIGTFLEIKGCFELE